MTRVTIQEAIKHGWIKPEEVKQHKYHAEATTIEGQRFDSQKEANRWMELLLLKRAGAVVEIERQPRFELQPGYVDRSGRKVKPIYYVADFRVVYADGREVIEDVKGFKTAVYRMKAKMFRKTYPDKELVEI